MTQQFEQPTHAPISSGNQRPWNIRLEYKSGKTPEGFARTAKPEQVKAGFSFYDKNNNENIPVKEFTVWVVAVVSGIAGVTKDGEKYRNYYSSLVYDTRTQPMSVWMAGVDRPIETGYYAELKPKMPQGVGFTQVLICWCPELNEIIALTLTVGLSMQIQRAIGDVSGIPAKKVSLFSLCDLDTEFWGIEFTGNFDMKTKEGEPWMDRGEMYFMPKIKTGVVSIAKSPEQVERLKTYANEVRTYIESYVQRIIANNAGPSIQPEPPTRRQPASNAEEVPFPTEDVTSHTEDLPF